MLKVLRGSMVVMKSMRKNGVYALKLIVVSRSMSTIEQTVLSKTEIWHRILSHVSEIGIVDLKKQDLFGSDKIEKLGFCEHYVQGKACRLCFNLWQ